MVKRPNGQSPCMLKSPACAQLRHSVKSVQREPIRDPKAVEVKVIVEEAQGTGFKEESRVCCTRASNLSSPNL